MAQSKTGSPAGKRENFLSGLKNEIKKIVWPTMGFAFRNSGVVLSAIVLIGSVVFLLDKAFGELFKKFMSM
ncbi:MAG: preprotein translocase subunit SecE [Oscillospiraceae bacterium]|jgi:preprotein translocase SecE subunit|nr:preprotein translocase subunit SecE [Oscillospiraceae bacterium]